MDKLDMPTLEELAARHPQAEAERAMRLLPPERDHIVDANRMPTEGVDIEQAARIVREWEAAERDPTGRLPSEPGAKLDAGKNRIGLMVAGFPDALTAVAEVTTFGARKYSAHGWRTVPEGIDRYTDAMYRHLLAHARGEWRDRDSGLPHLAQAVWNGLAVLQLSLQAAPSTE